MMKRQWNKSIQYSALLIIALAMIATACTQQENFPKASQMVGLATPITLDYGQTSILTQDYFIDHTRIDSVTSPKGLTAELNGDKSEVLLKGNLPQKMGVLAYWLNGTAYHQLIKESAKQELTITFDPRGEEYEVVQLKGEMNRWNPSSTVLEKEGDLWKTTMLVNRGVYQYLFVVDGKEMLDPSNPETVPNGLGGTNSLLRVGKPPAELWLQTHEEDGGSVSLKSEAAENVMVLWQNHLLEPKVEKEIATVKIPDAASSMERSYIRAWTFDEQSVSNDVLIPLEYGAIVNQSNQLNRHDLENWNMYFVLIDRFKDGNPSNTRKVDDPQIHPKANYYGGDLEGIIQTIESGYFKNIGVNSLWLSPITQNPEGAYGLWDKGGVTTTFSGYHGYWPISSSKVDDRFGSGEKFQELLDVAHRHGMNVILDYVANHVHELHPVYQKHKDWATDLYLPDGRLNTELWEEQRLTTWFDTFMPTLDFSRPEVIETMSDSALFWVKEYDLDGFRHDATKHIQLEFWRTLTKKIKDSVIVPQNRKVFQIGETYGSRELIASYINSGLLDSQFDFNIFDASVNSFGKGVSFESLETQMNESFKYYGYHNKMGYISGNHDKTRFITLTSGEVSWGEDGKLAGWTREIESPQAFAYDRLSMLHAFNQTIPGIPVTYYGDEFGMSGANDPDNRRWMRFAEEDLSELELRNRNIFTKLAKLRNSHMALLYGDFRFHITEENTMAYSRAYFGNQVIAVYNKSNRQEQVLVSLRRGFDYAELKAEFGSDFEIEDGVLTITLPANSFELLTL
ncbi:MAG: alpha-amlyase [Balneolaceae bacterium]|nr:alpha-amlyase [Balneolaceae bacterium]